MLLVIDRCGEVCNEGNYHVCVLSAFSFSVFGDGSNVSANHYVSQVPSKVDVQFKEKVDNGVFWVDAENGYWGVAGSAPPLGVVPLTTNKLHSPELSQR